MNHLPDLLAQPNLNLARVDLGNPNLASEFYKRIADMINEFDRSLDHEHAVGVRLVSFGQSLTFHVTNIGYNNPSLIIFFGTLENGSPVQLIQHVSQISFLLTAIKRPDPHHPKKPIGFLTEEELKENLQGQDLQTQDPQNGDTQKQNTPNIGPQKEDVQNADSQRQDVQLQEVHKNETK